MWPVAILLITMKKYIFTASEKRKTPQLVEALEMLKRIYFKQEYVSKMQNQKVLLKKKILFHNYYSAIIFVTSTLCNITTVKSLELLGKHNSCKCELLLKKK